jgi:uncharacterized membrane protein
MNFDDFLNFKMFITTTFMKIIYIIGAIIITLGSLVLMVGFSMPFAYGISIGSGGVLAGLALLIFGNLGWRLLCEAITVVFSIHERLISVDSKLGAGSKPVLPKTQPLQTQPEGKFCNNCGAKVSSETKFCSNCGTAVSQ